MKKLIFAAVALSLLAGLCSCSKDAGANASSAEPGQASVLGAVPVSSALPADTTSVDGTPADTTPDTAPAAVSVAYESSLGKEFSGGYIDCTVSADEPAIIICTDKEVKNFQIFDAEINPDTFEVKLGAPLLEQAITLTPDKAVKLRVNIPEIVPTTVVSYEDADSTTKQFAISQSGEDGSAIKLEIKNGKLFG